MVAQLCQPAQRTCSHHGSLGQRFQGVIGVLLVHHQGVSGIFALGDATQHQTLRQVGGQILEGVNGDLCAAHQHLSFKLFGEQALVADLGKGDIKDLVSLGGHGFHRNGQTGMGLFEFSFDPIGLHHGQLASAGGDAQLLEGHGQGEVAMKLTDSKAPFRSRFHRMQALCYRQGERPRRQGPTISRNSFTICKHS